MDLDNDQVWVELHKVYPRFIPGMPRLVITDEENDEYNDCMARRCNEHLLQFVDDDNDNAIDDSGEDLLGLIKPAPPSPPNDNRQVAAATSMTSKTCFKLQS
jgi:hypothetical protein